MYYKIEGDYYGGQRLLSHEETREVFRIDPMEAKYSYKPYLQSEEFVTRIETRYFNFDLPWHDITVKSMELFTLGSYQTFGIPFPRKNEDHIEIYSGSVLNVEFDLRDDLSNYSAITSLPSEIYLVDKKIFF